MAKRGRPRKCGKRTESGRLSRAGRPSPIIKGNDRVEAMRERYGVHYHWAMGRAYAAGLLGDEPEATNRYQAAKRFVRVYRRFIGGEAYGCPLDQSPRGADAVDMTITDQQERDYTWLMAAMDSMDVAGVRPWFDQLISSLYVDDDPYWLASLLNGGKHPVDRMLLKAAIQALDIIAPEAKPMGIRVERWDDAA